MTTLIASSDTAPVASGVTAASPTPSAAPLPGAVLRAVLVPLDGSPDAERALPYALAIASRRRLPVRLLHVLPEQSGASIAERVFAGSADRPVAEGYLGATAARLGRSADLLVSWMVVDGQPEEVIRDIARRSEAILVTMATHGRTGLSRAILGSVGDRVLDAGTPVLLVHPRCEAADAARLFARILVPLDGSPEAEAILPAALALGELSDARLVLLRVIEPVLSGLGGAAGAADAAGADPEGAEERSVSARGYLERLARQLHIQGVVLDVRPAANVGRAIVDGARERGADLIAMSTRGRGASALPFGSAADFVLRAAPVPLLLLRPAAS